MRTKGSRNRRGGGTTGLDELAGVCEGAATRRSGRCNDAHISTACSARHERCNRQHATRIARRRRYAQGKLQQARTYAQRTRAAQDATRACGVQPEHATCDPLRAPRGVNGATCNAYMQHATLNNGGGTRPQRAAARPNQSRGPLPARGQVCARRGAETGGGGVPLVWKSWRECASASPSVRAAAAART